MSRPGEGGDRLIRFYILLQTAETGMLQYTTPRASQELWQQQQDEHSQILKEMVGHFEVRLVEYDGHIQDLYRKVVHGRGRGNGGSLSLGLDGTQR